MHAYANIVAIVRTKTCRMKREQKIGVVVVAASSQIKNAFDVALNGRRRTIGYSTYVVHE